MATPRLFPVLGIPLKRGRFLEDNDVPGQRLVAIINSRRSALLGERRSDRPNNSLLPAGTSPSIQSWGPSVTCVRRGLAAGAARCLRAARPGSARADEGRAMTFIVRAQAGSAIVASARAAATELARAAAAERPADA